MTPAEVDVAIAGASFAGLACARALVRAGLSVRVLERKADVGQGLHTTGIVVKEAAASLDLPPGLARPIRRVRLYAPSLRCIELTAPDYFFLATDTPNLMRHLARRAMAEGVEIALGAPFAGGREDPDGRIALTGAGAAGAVRCRFLVGADGARSSVAASFDLGRNRRLLVGAEAEFPLRPLPGGDAFHCFLDQRRAPGYLGWVVPGVTGLQVGLATAGPQKPDLDGFLDHIRPVVPLERGEATGRRGGLIPVGGPVSPLSRGAVALTGDAAGIVSPLSAGGIHMADHFGARLGAAIAAHLAGAGPHPGRVAARIYPRFRAKRLQRAVFETCAPNWLLNAVIGAAPFRWAAEGVFFREKRTPGGGV